MRAIPILISQEFETKEEAQELLGVINKFIALLSKEFTVFVRHIPECFEKFDFDSGTSFFVARGRISIIESPMGELPKIIGPRDNYAIYKED